MKGLKEDISAIFTITSCVVGAGFVSGKELIMLLGSTNAIASSIIFALLYGMAIYAIMNYCNRHNIHSSIQWSQNIAGKYYKYLNALMLICYFTMTVTMLATINETMCYVLNISSNLPIYSLAVAIAVAIFVCHGNKGLQLLCTVSVPIIILVIILCSATNTDNMSLWQIIPNTTQIAGYVVFNSVLSIGVLAPMSHTAHRGRVAISTAIILAILIATILIVMDHYPTNSYNIPLLSLSTSGYDMALYTICILLSATVSVASNSYIVSSHLEQYTHHKYISVIIVLSLSLLLSMFGLDMILPAIYPIITSIGILMLVLIVAKKHTNH